MEEYWLVAIAVVALEKLLNWGFVKQKKKGVNSCFHSCGVGSKASLIGYQPPGCSALVQYGPYCPMLYINPKVQSIDKFLKLKYLTTRFGVDIGFKNERGFRYRNAGRLSK